MTVGVIIPSLNERDSIRETVASAFAAGADQVIVADGGSVDGTMQIAQTSGARVLNAPRGRALQMNAGARSATSDVLLFLHADTTLPPSACDSVSRAAGAGHLFGGFEIAFREDDWRLRVVERFINLRSRFTREPWGDQAQFIERSLFVASGGFREIPILEDYVLAREMRRLTEPAILPPRVVTSGRRFLANGVIATVATNWRIILSYEMGERLDSLAAMYRHGS